jgi:hypothetical protein
MAQFIWIVGSFENSGPFLITNVNDLLFFQEKIEICDFLKNIKKLDIFDRYLELIELYKNFTDTLDLDQKVALINIIGYYMIFNAIVSIFSILAANHYLKLWKIEEKFPKLAKYLKTRENISNKFLVLHVVMLFSILFIYTIINLFIIFFKHLI